MHNDQLIEEYLTIVNDLEGDPAGRRKAFDYMQESTAIYHGEVILSSFLPRLFDRKTRDLFANIAETIYGILTKAMQHFIDDPVYRTLFSFDERLTDLILIPRGYECPLPVARVDLFLNEKTGEFGFCEFNTDGTSGMNENREVTAAVSQSESFKEFGRRHRLDDCELFDSWIDEFLAIYATYERKTEQPSVAICDFLEHATITEFHIFQDRFQERGIDCRIVDVRDLRFDGETLYDGDEKPIDIVWRRCIYKDVMDHWRESQPLIEAMRAGAVAVIGSFLGTIAHDKRIFSILHEPETQAFLTPAENEFVAKHIPATTYLDGEHIDLDQVKDEKDSWIIKPTDDNGATDVYAGIMFDDITWENLIDRYADDASGRPFLAQRFIMPFATPVITPDDERTLAQDDAKVEAVPYNNMSGLYLYNGKFAGVFSRLGPRPVIHGAEKGITCATIWVDCD